MKKIKFELIDDDAFCPQHSYAEIELLGDVVDDYLQAFKAFLVACSFTEATVSEITTREQAFLDWEKENRDLTYNQ